MLSTCVYVRVCHFRRKSSASRNVRLNLEEYQVKTPDTGTPSSQFGLPSDSNQGEREGGAICMTDNNNNTETICDFEVDLRRPAAFTTSLIYQFYTYNLT